MQTVKRARVLVHRLAGSLSHSLRTVRGTFYTPCIERSIYEYACAYMFNSNYVAKQRAAFRACASPARSTNRRQGVVCLTVFAGAAVVVVATARCGAENPLAHTPKRSCLLLECACCCFDGGGCLVTSFHNVHALALQLYVYTVHREPVSYIVCINRAQTSTRIFAEGCARIMWVRLNQRGVCICVCVCVGKQTHTAYKHPIFLEPSRVRASPSVLFLCCVSGVRVCSEYGGVSRRKVQCCRWWRT